MSSTRALQERILRALGIPFSALTSIIFGMMIFSIPVGAYVMFGTDIGGDIDHGYPLRDLDFLTDEMGIALPVNPGIGDAFIVLWSVYAVVFAIGMLGPKKNFFGALGAVNAGTCASANSAVLMIKWFSVLILASAAINLVQESAGLDTEPSFSENDLVRFFEITRAPILEELGFRVLLIGVPLYAFYSHRASARHFLKSLWHPHGHLHIHEKKKAIALIAAVSLLFGIAHIISGDAWGEGKLAQAAASGMIIGWVYFRHGIVPALLVHWATNYFLYSYAYLVSEINLVTVQQAFSHSMLQTFEILFLITGALSISMMIICRLQKKKLEV